MNTGATLIFLFVLFAVGGIGFGASQIAKARKAQKEKRRNNA